MPFAVFLSVYFSINLPSTLLGGQLARDRKSGRQVPEATLGHLRRPMNWDNRSYLGHPRPRENPWLLSPSPGLQAD
jgi:hypothetical protein